ncbi:hypothetical protein BDV18DRAFT_168010 [Aspergillus unguis]
MGKPADLKLLADELRSLLKADNILTPESSGYKDSILRWSDAVPNAAALVVFPESADEVNATVQGCIKYSVPFAVTCGRHTTSTGSSCDGGLIIDLAKINSVVLDAGSKTVRVGGGCRARDLNVALEGTGLAVIQGIVDDTGIGGITLGGGYGWLSGRHGLLIDNLVSVTMVVADGRIVVASEHENPDLFWGVRGAGQCFGVAVEFIFRAHEIEDPVWGGVLGLPLSQLEAVIEFGNELVEKTNGDSAMVVQIGRYPWSNSQRDIGVLPILFHAGREDAAKTVFQPLLDLDPIFNTTTEQSWKSLNGMLTPEAMRGGRTVSKGAAYTTPLRPSFLRESIVPQLERLATVPRGTRSFLEFEFYHPDKWCEIPRVATAHGHRGQHQNVMIALYWTDAGEDIRMEKWSRQIAESVEAERRTHGRPSLGPVTEYGNYDHLSADPRNVFGDCYGRLVDLKGKWDPANVFNKWYSLV